MSTETKKKEIYTYQAPWNLYSCGWSYREDQLFRLAVGSFLEEYANKVSVVQLNEESGKFHVKHTFDHPYPTTKVMFLPSKNTALPDMIATTGDYLRLWNVAESGVTQKCLLNNVR